MDTTSPGLPARTVGHAALRRGRVSMPGHAYLVTTTTHRRRPLFAAFPRACMAARHFEDPQILRGSRMLAWVLMPDHAHWLIHLGERDNLSQCVNRLKTASARHVRQQTAGPTVWARGFHDHALRDDEALREVARYVVANPLRAGLVRRLGDYPFWNAAWL